jgi:hypothetical protein
LREFAQGEPERVSDIARFFDDKDWENYSIVVHSLKSSSKTIGAEGLSELAARLETAADAGREHRRRAGSMRMGTVTGSGIFAQDLCMSALIFIPSMIFTANWRMRTAIRAWMS